jgi:thiamine biosynthesis lipoprotein
MNDTYQTQFKTWSCDFILEIIEGTQNPSEIVAAIKATLDEYEHAFSRFLPNSDLSRLNTGATITHSPLWQVVLAEATNLSQTIGPEYFNPHVNLASHGYKASIEALPQQTEANPLTGHLTAFPEGLLVKDETLTLTPGCTLDWGSFLKGFVSAHIADQYANTATGLIINFGGDMSLRGHEADGSAFKIGIHNPITNTEHWVELQNQSLCTSGTYKRTWHNARGHVHHILDPKTNANSQSDFVSISFWGSDAALCDALATAAFNAPTAQWDKWRKAAPDLHYLAIKTSGQVIRSDKNQ